MSEAMQATEAAAAPGAVGAVLGQLMGDLAGAAGAIVTELGMRLGLWDALAAGAATAETVAERAGAAVPYVREWLGSQAAAGYVAYDPAAGTFAPAPGGGRRAGRGAAVGPGQRRGQVLTAGSGGCGREAMGGFGAPR